MIDTFKGKLLCSASLLTLVLAYSAGAHAGSTSGKEETETKSATVEDQKGTLQKPKAIFNMGEGAIPNVKDSNTSKESSSSFVMGAGGVAD